MWEPWLCESVSHSATFSMCLFNRVDAALCNALIWLVDGEILQVDAEVWVQLRRDLRLAATAVPVGCGPSEWLLMWPGTLHRLENQTFERTIKGKVKGLQEIFRFLPWLYRLHNRLVPEDPPLTKLINKAIQRIICALEFLFVSDTSCFQRTAACLDPTYNKIWVK